MSVQRESQLNHHLVSAGHASPEDYFYVAKDVWQAKMDEIRRLQEECKEKQQELSMWQMFYWFTLASIFLLKLLISLGVL